MRCCEVQKRLAEYSVGLVNAGEKARIEGHLSQCPDCVSELRKLDDVMSLVSDVEAVEPPVGLWNGVYNRITAPAPPESAWDRFRRALHQRTRSLSVGLVTAALATVMLISHVNHPGTEQAYAADEYLQGHATYASQDLFADQAALDSVAAIAYREQVGGEHE